MIKSYLQYQKLIRIFQEKYIDFKNIKNLKIDLKSSILEYFQFKLENKEEWMKELISIIKDKEFLSQNTLISLFKYDIYKLIIRPKLLNQVVQEKFYPQSHIFKYKIYDEKKIVPIEKIKMKERFELFDVIKNQILNEINPFNIIITNFKSCFTKVIKNKIKILNKLKLKTNDIKYNKLCVKVFEELKNQVNEFVTIIAKFLTSLYKINNIRDYGTYYAILMNIFFAENDNSNELYELFMELIKEIQNDKIKKFKSVILGYKSINPEDFLIQDKFCLNDKTKQKYQKIFKEEIGNNDQMYPYEKSIAFLKKMYEYKNPFDKLMVTHLLSEYIKDDINEYWDNIKEEELMKNKVKLNIESDDLLNIIKYLLIKGNFGDIDEQIYFIESFTSIQIKSDNEYYNLSLIMSCLDKFEENELN